MENKIKKSELIRFRCTENLRNAVLLGCQRTGMNISEFIETAAELMVDYTIHNARPDEMRMINRYGVEFARNELQIIMRPIALITEEINNQNKQKSED